MARILLAGASGLTGFALRAAFEHRGDEVRRLVRRETSDPREFAWSPDDDLLPDAALDGVDVVVNLCGVPIGPARWSAARRRAIRSSRVLPTHLLAHRCATHRIPVLVNAGATGFYGDRGDELLDESSPSGGGFLADTCVAWECALRPAEDAGTRVVCTRFGVVLAAGGGALQTMLPAFRWGLGGPLGSGAQWFPWIHIDDLVGAIFHVIEDSGAHGPQLLVSPEPNRQKEFARALGHALHRPAILPAPRRILEALLGGMARELLFASQRCLPRSLSASGYVWRHPDLGSALQDLLGER